jgi:hypothetical protein
MIETKRLMSRIVKTRVVVEKMVPTISSPVLLTIPANRALLAPLTPDRQELTQQETFTPPPT